ncbi:MAG TPA: DUF1841 family protein, partial [Ramlibacter sp.]|nr:DUF1841 family protein [Ramlibacter sp.]
MFNPSQDDVRRFFCGVAAKAKSGAPMDALETLAGQWVSEHPEYAGDVGDEAAALAAQYDGSNGQSNPFLHMSMHL